jgi:hypothetical protein
VNAILVAAAAAAATAAGLPAANADKARAAESQLATVVSGLIKAGTTIAISEALFTATLNAALPGARDAAVFNAKGLGPDGGGAANYANADAYLLNKPAAINVVAHGYVNVAINDQEAMAGAVGDGAFTNGFFLDPAILPLVPAPGGVVHVNKAALCARWTGL